MVNIVEGKEGEDRDKYYGSVLEHEGYYLMMEDKESTEGLDEFIESIERMELM